MRGFAVLLILFVVINVMNAEISSLENAQLSQCGINSLYLCLKYHKVQVNLADMYLCIKPDMQNDVSLRQLSDYAKSEGLYVKPIIKPSVEDIKKSLQSGHSIILQYNSVLPDNSEFKHIVAMIYSDAKIYLLDYPKPKQEILPAGLNMLEGESDGLLILSDKPFMLWKEYLSLSSLKSVSFYMVACGILSLIMFYVIEKYKIKTWRTKA